MLWRVPAGAAGPGEPRGPAGGLFSAGGVLAAIRGIALDLVGAGRDQRADRRDMYHQVAVIGVAPDVSALPKGDGLELRGQAALRVRAARARPGDRGRGPVDRGVTEPTAGGRL